MKRLNLVCVKRAIQDQLAAGTGLPVHDVAPKDFRPPFYLVEIIGKRPANNKLQFQEVLEVYVHAFSPAADSTVAAYDMLHGAEEALTDPLPVPAIIGQEMTGLQALYIETTGDHH